MQPVRFWPALRLRLPFGTLIEAMGELAFRAAMPGELPDGMSREHAAAL